jgi:hypothetical protein
VLPRSPRITAGYFSNSRWWKARYSVSGFGTTYGADRWKTVSEPTRSAIAGTNWIALAPVPTTATRVPSSGTSWRHCAEWNAGPAKESRPGTSGTTGSESWPTAETTTSASYVVPSVVSTRQVAPASSHVAADTSWPVRTRSSSPASPAAPRR